MTPDPTMSSSELDRVVARLRAEESDLGVQAADAIYAELRSYATVERRDVEQSVGRNTDRAIRAITDGRAPSMDTRAEAASTSMERVRAGVPIEDVIRGYRVSLGVIHERFLELAKEYGVPADTVLGCSTLLWRVGDWFTARAAVEYRNHSLRQAVRETVRREELTRELIAGSLDDVGRRSAASSLGLQPDGQYAVVVAPPRGAEGVERVRSAVERCRPSGVIFTLPSHTQGEICIGLVHASATLGAVGCPVAMGPATGLDELARSEAMAQQVAETLAADMVPGVYRHEDVSWRVARAASPETTALLHEKYLAPVATEGDFGDLLLDSVRALLLADLKVAAAAETLVVHQNTLRHRVARYEEIIGVSLTDIQAVVELAWALDLPPRWR